MSLFLEKILQAGTGVRFFFASLSVFFRLVEGEILTKIGTLFVNHSFRLRFAALVIGSRFVETAVFTDMNIAAASGAFVPKACFRFYRESFSAKETSSFGCHPTTFSSKRAPQFV